MCAHVRPDPRLMERLAIRIRSRDGSRASWIAGGEGLALGIRGAGRDGMPLWASDLADAMVGSLLRVLDRSVDEADLTERVGLAAAAVVLSVARPHCAFVLDGAVDAWLGWTPEAPSPACDRDTLALWTLLALLRGEAEEAAEAVWALCERDDERFGTLLHDWVVARIQGHGPDREVQCFHALRAALAATDGAPPALGIVAAAVAVRAMGGRRDEVLPWLDRIALELAEDGTSRATPAESAPRRARL